MNNRERCLREIADAVANQRLYPAERDLAILGEMDWREELWMQELPYEVLERAAIAEYDGKLTRKQAEALALAEWRKNQEKSK